MGHAKYNNPHGQLFDVEDIKLTWHADSDLEEDEEMDDVSEYVSPQIDMSSTGATWELKHRFEERKGSNSNAN